MDVKYKEIEKEKLFLKGRVTSHFSFLLSCFIADEVVGVTDRGLDLIKWLAGWRRFAGGEIGIFGLVGGTTIANNNVDTEFYKMINR